VSLPVAARRKGIHRVDQVACGNQGSHEQPPVDLDTDHDLGWLLGVGGHDLVQASHAV
jgi:hypothetical protein